MGEDIGGSLRVQGDVYYKILMIRLLLTVLAASLCTIEPSFAQDETPDRAHWNNSADASVGSVIAFVGEKIFVEERNLEETMDFTLEDGSVIKRKVPKWSDRYEARYKVIETIGGDYTAPEIDFEAWDHYGRPTFPKYNPILLFAVNRDGKWILQKNIVKLVFETTDGDWAQCGGLRTSSWTEKFEPDAASYEEPIGFLDPPQSAEGTPCLSGVRASKIFAFEEKTFFAPQRRRIACNRKMGENDGVNVGTGSAPDRELKARVHAACVSRLEAEDNL